MLCGCVAGAASALQIETWLGDAGFSDVRISVKVDKRELVVLGAWPRSRTA